MTELEKVLHRVVDRVNVNLRELSMDVGSFVRTLVVPENFVRFYAFYGFTPHHPLSFRFHRSGLAGSYFLGKCVVDHSIVYKSDVRGDELKTKGETLKCGSLEIPLHEDEVIRIKDSFLVKTLVHSNSHDPESPEEFLIQNTVALHYANIHGSPIEGSFLGPFGTVDLTTVHDCIIGSFAYVQKGELAHARIDPGRIWVQAGDVFEFNYQYSPQVLEKYIHLEAGKKPRGKLVDFVEGRKKDYEEIFGLVGKELLDSLPGGTKVSRYAVVKGRNRIEENVLVAQRAYIEDSRLGKGSNAQENCYIVQSELEGNDVTAHGGKVICATLGNKVFVGFNSFLHGTPSCRLTVGEGSIVMPHTLIDLEQPLEIPAKTLVWGYIRSPEDLASQTIPLEKLAHHKGELHLGSMHFRGSGHEFVHGFQHRIEHILEANGAFFDGNAHPGHAQKTRNISYNTIQPYPDGPLKGLYPTIEIRP